MGERQRDADQRQKGAGDHIDSRASPARTAPSERQTEIGEIPDQVVDAMPPSATPRPRRSRRCGRVSPARSSSTPSPPFASSAARASLLPASGARGRHASGPYSRSAARGDGGSSGASVAGSAVPPHGSLAVRRFAAINERLRRRAGRVIDSLSGLEVSHPGVRRRGLSDAASSQAQPRGVARLGATAICALAWRFRRPALYPPPEVAAVRRSVPRQPPGFRSQ